MKRDSGKVCMAKLARVTHQLAEIDARRAELLSEQARIYDELSEGETVDMRTGRRHPTIAKRAPLAPVAAEDRALAQAALRDNSNRRRSGT
jgi:hypothetical protein